LEITLPNYGSDMDRLEAMATLLAAVENGSLSAASRKLGMPLATVSRRVSELEAHLHTKLVNRTSRKLTLTEAGRSYIAACKKILEDIGEAERAATGEYSAPKGDLTVTAPIVFGRLHVLPAALDFLKAYPDIDLRLVLTDRVANLFEEPADLAVRIGELADSSLIAAKLGSIRRVICASPAYLAARGTPQSPYELGAHDCITFEGLMSPKSWTFRAGKSDITVPIHSRLTVNTAEAAIDAAIAGVGISRVLSYQIAQALESGALLTALEIFEPMPLPVSLVYRGQGQLPLKLRAFLDFAGPKLRARLAKLGCLS
jgi:DNA-binding transcriptional LysR family regulator